MSDGPEPEAAAPDTFVDDELQENVVPATLLLKDKAALSPEQIVKDDGVDSTLGIGSTVNVAEIGLPEQPAATGVIV